MNKVLALKKSFPVNPEFKVSFKQGPLKSSVSYIRNIKCFVLNPIVVKHTSL